METEPQCGGKVAIQNRYYISTLPPHEVETVTRGIRSHWGIRHKRMLAAMSPDYRMAAMLGFPLASPGAA